MKWNFKTVKRYGGALAFSLSSLTFIKGLFSSSLSAIRVVLSAYLRLLIFLLAILIPYIGWRGR